MEQRVIFNVVNFSKTKSLYRDGMSPVVKSTSRPKWCGRRSSPVQWDSHSSASLPAVTIGARQPNRVA
uniref:Uncharacterized protein n=1 Tax=Knipowitschia caucasica TaxID=637954 RepID=A0AAV2KUI6_KNICA